MLWKQLADVVAPIIQSFTSIAGVVGIVLLWRQIRETNRWNQISTQHVLLSNLPSFELDTLFWNTFQKYKAQDSWTITPDNCKQLYDSISDWTLTKAFLNKHEHLCAAINAKLLDEEYAFRVHGAKIVDVFRSCESYLTYVRELKGDYTIYIELEQVATRWGARAKQEEAQAKGKANDLKASRASARPSAN